MSSGQVLVQQVINPLSLGSIYALVAIGLAMVFGILRLINFAHGDIMMVGAYASALLNMAPADKAMHLPDLPAWLSGLEQVLDGYVAGGWLTAAEAEEWAWLILCRNALRIYQVRLPGVA